MNLNPINAIDFYKADHRRQYPDNTQLVVSNLTPRSNKHAPQMLYWRDRICFFGLQYFIKDFLQNAFQKGFFDKPLEDVLRRYQYRMDWSLGKGAISVEHISALHKLGYLPIEIKALPEGTRVPVGIPVLTIHNTLPDFFWLTNYLETILSAYLWLPSTSATMAMNYRKLFDCYAEITGIDNSFCNFQGHDFSFRGMAGPQSAVMSGAGHLLSFKGTDTLPAIDFLEEYYDAKNEIDLIGCSVPATEHSVMCMGEETNEFDTFDRLISVVYPKGIVSIVSDTWDFWQVLTDFSLRLKDKILSRDGKVVFRPDSGDPVKIICGDPYATPGSPEQLGAVRVLWDIFGGTHTPKGFKQLDSHVGLIYGDSITYDRASEILSRLYEAGFASSNIVLGIGSYTYQYVTRDTWGWAVKATYGTVAGEARNISKNPKTDDGVKKSLQGLLKVYRNVHGELKVEENCPWCDFVSHNNLLRTVYRDGSQIVTTSLHEIRDRIRQEKI